MRFEEKDRESFYAVDFCIQFCFDESRPYIFGIYIEKKAVFPFLSSPKFSGDLLHRLKIDGGTDDYIEQLIPTTSPISKIKIKFFGHSGVGKTCIIDSLKAGYFSSLFRRGSKRNSSFSGMILFMTSQTYFSF